MRRRYTFPASTDPTDTSCAGHADPAYELWGAWEDYGAKRVKTSHRLDEAAPGSARAGTQSSALVPKLRRKRADLETQLTVWINNDDGHRERKRQPEEQHRQEKRGKRKGREGGRLARPLIIREIEAFKKDS